LPIDPGLSLEFALGLESNKSCVSFVPNTYYSWYSIANLRLSGLIEGGKTGGDGEFFLHLRDDNYR
jgi:hypothetical protein